MHNSVVFYLWFIVFVLISALHPFGFAAVTIAFLIWLTYQWSRKKEKAREKESLLQTQLRDAFDELLEKRKTYSDRAASLELQVLEITKGEPYVFQSEFDAMALASTVENTSVVTSNDYHYLIQGSKADENLHGDLLNEYLEAWCWRPSVEEGYLHYLLEQNSIPESAAAKAHTDRLSSERTQHEEEEARLKAANVRTRTKEDAGPNATALYIMHSEAGTKVGFSSNLKQRLSQLKTPHPGELKLHRAWWFRNREAASRAEKSTHRLLKKEGVHMNREWFSISAEEAEKAVNKVIDEIYGIRNSP